ncbi:MAG: hypothetical protein OEW15_07915 [Nitrospirota bacterium]|nr:hypothetical protein [Nitrospirota bacterium]
MIDESKLCHTISAFVDLLGFSDKVRSVRSKEELEEIEKALRKVRDEFEYRSSDIDIQRMHALYKKEVLAFSDCIVISIPIKSDMTETEGAFDSIMSEFTSFAYAQGNSVLNGYFLRGGIDFGWWYADGDLLISPAMANAYNLEREANVPVLMLSDQVYGYFEKHKHRKHYSNDIDPIPMTFRKYAETKSKTPKYFIDYLNICMQSVGWHTSMKQIEEYRQATGERKSEIMTIGYRSNAIKLLQRHRDAITTASKNISDTHVRAKYEWLAQYHNTICEENGFIKDCAI